MQIAIDPTPTMPANRSDMMSTRVSASAAIAIAHAGQHQAFMCTALFTNADIQNPPQEALVSVTKHHHVFPTVLESHLTCGNPVAN